MKIGENLNDNYDNNKDFFILVVDVYIVECFMEYFGMENQFFVFIKYVFVEFICDEEK